MIKKIKKIKLPKCNAYFKDSNGKNHLIGVVENASEFNWLCIQAIKENTNGYFVKWKKEIINIDRFGGINSCPDDFYFSISLNETCEINRLASQNYNKNK